MTGLVKVLTDIQDNSVCIVWNKAWRFSMPLFILGLYRIHTYLHFGKIGRIAHEQGSGEPRKK